MKLSYHRRVQAEVDEAVDWYEERVQDWEKISSPS